MNDGRLRITYDLADRGHKYKVTLDDRELTELMPISRIDITLTPDGFPKVMVEIQPTALDLDASDVDVTYQGTLEEE